jgi:hypothetical protein
MPPEPERPEQLESFSLSNLQRFEITQTFRGIRLISSDISASLSKKALLQRL